MLTAIALCSVLVQGQCACLVRQEPSLTSEDVASTIARLAEEFEKQHLSSRDPAFRKRLSEELVRLNKASEETVRKVDELWRTGYDELILPKMIITRLWFLLRYRPPTPDGGFTDMEFTSFHGYIFVSRLEAGEDQDFPTLSSPGYDDLTPSERYDWPWELTKDGWQLRWFAVHGGGSESFAGIYERFRKLPRRDGVTGFPASCFGSNVDGKNIRIYLGAPNW
jgi:hypothetical protein